MNETSALETALVGSLALWLPLVILMSLIAHGLSGFVRLHFRERTDDPLDAPTAAIHEDVPAYSKSQAERFGGAILLVVLFTIAAVSLAIWRGYL